MQTKEAESTKATTSVLLAGLIVMSTIVITASIIMMSSIQSASAAPNLDGKKLSLIN